MVLGPFLATKYFKPALEKSGVGKVLNISSNSNSIAQQQQGRREYRIPDGKDGVEPAGQDACAGVGSRPGARSSWSRYVLASSRLS